MKYSEDGYDIEWHEMRDVEISLDDFDTQAKLGSDVVDPQVLVNGGHWTVAAASERRPTQRTAYQSEAQMEDSLVAQLVSQGYERVSFSDDFELVANVRAQMERLNRTRFTDAEWDELWRTYLGNPTLGIVGKTRLIQQERRVSLRREDGSTANVMFIDPDDLMANHVQVMQQYTQADGAHENRYDVTILVNGLPMVQIELKRRGVAIRQAFSQIKRYQEESFWSGTGLFEFIQIFVISNGTHTKYYSNTTRNASVEAASKPGGTAKKASGSFSFTQWWADSNNRRIEDLETFTETFLAKRTLLAMICRYSVFTVSEDLMIMRPYQVAASERILNRVLVSESNPRRLGTPDAGGYIWHTTGSGKTLTSFKTAQLATKMEGVDRVIFVVDRKDLDSQTIAEFNKFSKDSVNGTNDSRELGRNLKDKDTRITVTTIQKFGPFLKANPKHPVFDEHVVIIFDECHRSQFGTMHRDIVKKFKNYHIFGFTGTPIFPLNAQKKASPLPMTTEQAFGDRLHSYTIVDGVRDGNVLPFRVDYFSTFEPKEGLSDEQVDAISKRSAYMNPARIQKVTEYILANYGRKVKADRLFEKDGKRVRGFNSLMAVDSIAMARAYYEEFKRRQEGATDPLKIALIYTYEANQEQADGILADEAMDTDKLDQRDREFLEAAMADYNEMFGTHWSTNGSGFSGYYEDVSKRLKNRELDMAIVVNIFLTGFDAKTLNTLWVDKDLKYHGLIQAFSRTNRIFNSVKAYGNVVCFRNIEDRVNDAIALFGDKDAGGIIKLRPYKEYVEEYEDVLGKLYQSITPGETPDGLQAQERFIRLMGALLRLRNILTAFDEFEGDDTLTPATLQDWLSIYEDLRADLEAKGEGEPVSIADDLVFEVELLKSVDIDLDYILMLVEKMGDGNNEDDEIKAKIERSLGASHELRSKRDLIMDFVNADHGGVMTITDQWNEYIKGRHEKEFNDLVAQERLKPDAAAKAIARFERAGEVPTVGTEVIELLASRPSRFAKPEGGASLEERKRSVIEAIQAFIDRFKGLGA